MAVEITFCSPAEHPALHRLATAQLEAWPEHEKFLRRRFGAGGDVARFVADYRWMCDRVMEEELHFRREGRYRLSSFAEADREVYSNKEYMARYMNGLLLSQIWWANHTAVITYYADEFLAGNRAGYRHLEIGPGHGLLLYFAARDPRCEAAGGWDLSDASIEATHHALRVLGAPREARLVKQSVFDAAPPGERYDSVVISEVCEHLEDPKAALANLRGVLAPGGRLFVNMPINSPAPDHLFLLRTPEEVVDLVRSSGYEIEASRAFPLSGYTEEKARKAGLTMSCVVVARPRD
jgi:2-polyprenyl-3-methyl-5-hydroxy-6-metoxy-1,4-benzoquinol methylase